MEYYLTEVEKIVGILLAMLHEPADEQQPSRSAQGADYRLT